VVTSQWNLLGFQGALLMSVWDTPLTLKQREKMVTEQLIARGIRDKRVLEAFRKLPRHLFVPKEYLSVAYQDSPLSIGEGQTISQPYIVALMVELLEVSPSDKILEIGTGSGYQTAILAELASMVVSVERISVLAQRALQVLRRLGYNNVHFVIGDGSKGVPELAPYDKIIVSACSDKIYPAWVEELREGGYIVLPLGESYTSQELVRASKKKDGTLQLEYFGGCVFVPLIEDKDTSQS